MTLGLAPISAAFSTASGDNTIANGKSIADTDRYFFIILILLIIGNILSVVRYSAASTTQRNPRVPARSLLGAMSSSLPWVFSSILLGKYQCDPFGLK